LKSDSNPKSTPLHSGIKGKNIRGRRKRKSHDDDEMLIKSIFDDLVKIPKRVETPDRESITVCKYYDQAERVVDSVTTMESENPFVISMYDLSPYVRANLLNSHRKDHIMYQAVERIIKNCGSERLGANKKSRFVKYPWLIQP
jgi:hypothetical protein